MRLSIRLTKTLGAAVVVLLTGLLTGSAAWAQVAGPFSVFTVSPCRILDTRFASPLGPVPASGTRNILVAGDLTAGGTVNQGGASACSVPDGATGVFINVVAVSPTGPGYLTVYPYNKALPSSSTLNFAAGQNIANSALVALCTPASSCNRDLSITMGQAGAHLVIDVTGFLWPVGQPISIDTQGPTVSLSSPASGTTYTTAQTVTLNATASDNVGVTRVDFYDGSTLKASVSSPPYTYAWAITSASNGTHSWMARAWDLAGNGTTSAASTVTVNIGAGDPPPPTVSISSPASGTTYTTAQSVTLTASASDNVGVTRVEFYDGASLQGTATVAPYTYAWTLSSALNGTHNWTAKAYDADGNVATSTAVSLTVNIPVSDVTPPTVSISSPASGSVFTTAQTVTITASAADNVGVTRVEFYDSATLKSTVTSPPYVYAWAILSSLNGSHSWTAKAYDAAGNSATSTAVSLTVNIPVSDVTPPTVSISSPASGSVFTIAQTVTITASAADNVGVTRVEFYDGVTLKSTVTSPPYVYAWAILSSLNGSHSWTAKAYDAAGNSATSAAVSLTVNIAAADVTPPTVSISSPASGTTYTSAQTVTITASAADNVGVTRVEFYDGAAFKGSVTAPPYGWSWAFTAGDNGAHSWTAKAYDAAGNSASSAAVVLNVNISGSVGTPALVGYVPGLGEAKAAVVVGGLAFTASDPFGLSVVNVANASSPTILGVSNVPFLGRAIAVSGSRAVVLGQTAQGLEHLWVLDLTVASRPRVVGELSTTLNISSFNSVGVALNGSGTLAAITMDFGVGVVDLRNPASPVLLGTCALPSRALALAINSAGTYAYVADGGSHLQIVSLASRTVAGSLSLGGTQIDITIAENGSTTMAYMVNQSGLLQVVDASNASSPVFKGALTLSGFGVRVSVEGSVAAVLSYDSTNDYLDVVNVSNPTVPTKTSTVVIQSGHQTTGVDLSNGVAYVTSGAAGLKIYSVSGTPSSMGRINDDFLAQAITAGGRTAVIFGKDVPSNTIRLEVLDLTDPTAPRVASALPTALSPINTGTAVAINSTGTLAAVALGVAGVELVDVTNPAAPVVRGVYDTVGSATAVALNSAATYAYVADNGNGHLQIVNISNPNAPTLAGSLLNMIGTQVDIAIVEAGGTTMAYMVSSSGLLQIVDVTNPAAPALKGSLTLSGFGSRVAAQGNLAVVLSYNSTNNYLDVVDVSSPFVPVKKASPVVGAPGTAKSVALMNGLAYVAANTEGLLIYDVSNPAAPVLRNTVPTIGDALGVALTGGYAYVADFPATVDSINLGQ